MDPATASSVAARARTENFPVASLLFPRALRPHLRAIYGFARLVDILGDELEGDRLAALDELEAQVEACYDGEPTWEVMRELQPTIRACSLPREPFLRLIEANRMDQRISEYETWADLKHYCVHSADPGRAARARRARARTTTRSRSRSPTTSAPACSSSTSCRTCRATSRSGASTCPRRTGAASASTELDRPSPELRRLLEFEAERARALLASGEELGQRLGGGRVGRAVALFARGGLAALEALERADWDIFNGRPRPSRARLALAAIR